jgi:BirA family biotin operon repressor/biotin-[acetyl-CoA-carboxylase] ligase
LLESARDVAGVTVQLKWPNDLVIAGDVARSGLVRSGVAPSSIASSGAATDCKVAGLLAESTSDGALVVGAGLNVAWAPEAAQVNERSGALQAVNLDAVAGRPVDRGELLVGALLAMDRLYGNWDLVSRLYRDKCATVGRQVTVSFAGHRPDGAALGGHRPDLVGSAIAVDEDGRLVVRVAGGADVAVAAGDVTHTSGSTGPSLSG